MIWSAYFFVSAVLFLFGTFYAREFEVLNLLGFAVFLGAFREEEKKWQIKPLHLLLSLGLFSMPFVSKNLSVESICLFALGIISFYNLNLKNRLHWFRLLSLILLLSLFIFNEIQTYTKLFLVLLYAFTDYISRYHEEAKAGELVDLVVPFVVAGLPIMIEIKIACYLLLLIGRHFRLHYLYLLPGVVFINSLPQEYQLLYIALCMIPFGGHWLKSTVFLLQIAILLVNSELLPAAALGLGLLHFILLHREEKQEDMKALIALISPVVFFAYLIYKTEPNFKAMGLEQALIMLVPSLILFTRFIYKFNFRVYVFQRSDYSVAKEDKITDQYYEPSLIQGNKKRENSLVLNLDKFMLVFQIIIWGAVCIFLF